MKMANLSGLNKLSWLAVIVFTDQLLKFALLDQAAKNPGIGLGLLANLSQWKILFFVILLLILVGFLMRGAKSQLEKVGWLLIFSGAFSNLLDRLFYQAVIDPFGFLGFQINLADLVVTMGALALISAQVKRTAF